MGESGLEEEQTEAANCGLVAAATAAAAAAASLDGFDVQSEGTVSWESVDLDLVRSGRVVPVEDDEYPPPLAPVETGLVWAGSVEDIRPGDR